MDHMIADIIIFAMIVLYSAFVTRKLLRDKKRGICTGCSASSCSSCSRCNDEYIDALIRKTKKKA